MNKYSILGFGIIMLMANNKTTKKKTTFKKPVKSDSRAKSGSFWAFVKTHKLLMTVLFILFAIATWYIFVQIIIINERKALNNAEKSLDGFTSQLQEVVGNEAPIDKNKSCSYKSTKFVSKGNPSCGISYQVRVPVNSAEQATNYANEIDRLTHSGFVVTSMREGKFVDNTNSNPLETYGYTMSLEKLNCSLSIDYFDPRDKSNNYEEKHEIYIEYGCADLNSHKEFYSVNN